MNKLVCLATALIASLAFPAWSQEYQAREIARWTIGDSTDGKACFISMEYEGDGATNLLLSLDIEGANSLMVDNYNWSTKDDEEYDIDYYLTAGVYDKHASRGYEHKGRHGFVTYFEAKFLTYFAASKSLDIRRGDVVVDELSLSGSGAAIAEMRRCVGLLKAKADAEAREKAKWAHIPKDPFAPKSNDNEK